MIERAEKKLLLDQMVNRERAEGKTVVSPSAAAEEEVTLTQSQMLDDIKFGCQAVFGGASDELPSRSDIEVITNRSRKESDSVGKLKGGTSHRIDSYDANKELSATQTYEGVDFAALRRENERKSSGTVPCSVKNIADVWMTLPSAKEKRKRKSRIMLVDGQKSGYGSASVPVLSSNNYDLEHGESSVFDRELSNSKKVAYAVPQKKKRTKNWENQEYCQVCGDGGMLILCPRCPVSVHPACCGIDDPKNFMSCSHHRCVSCNKSVQHAGGLLYPCQACPRSFCEDCLPAHNDVRIIGPCQRFEKLGFESEKQHAYINCSAHCERYITGEKLWTPPPPTQSREATCPNRIDVAESFGKLPEARPASNATSDADLEDGSVGSNSTSDLDRKVSARKSTSSGGGGSDGIVDLTQDSTDEEEQNAVETAGEALVDLTDD